MNGFNNFLLMNHVFPLDASFMCPVPVSGFKKYCSSLKKRFKASKE